MSREIKFRAWDKKNKSMLNEVAVSRNGKCAVSREDIFNLMQYTGLKDKNGKEIYEGDILKLKTNHVRDLNPSGEEKEYIVKCWFDKTTACFKFNDMTMEYRFLRENKGFEIIGNIHENPKLLESSNA